MLNKILQKRYIAAILATVLLANIALIASGLPFQDSSAQNPISTNQNQSPPADKKPTVTYKYPRYKPEMHAGDLALEIKSKLGYKLMAEFEGDTVDGSVTVGDEVTIVIPELSAQDKSVLDNIVRNHYSQRAAEVLKLHPDAGQNRPSAGEPAPNNSASVPLSNLEPNQIVPTAHTSVALQNDAETTIVSTTSTTFVDVPALFVNFDNTVAQSGLYLLSIEANNDVGRIDFRIVRQAQAGGGLFFTPIDIFQFGQDPTAQFWIRTLHGSETTIAAGSWTVKAQWKVSSSVGEGFFRVLTVVRP